jgi:hypothetical protein
MLKRQAIAMNCTVARAWAVAGAVLALTLLLSGGAAGAEQLAAINQVRLFGSNEIHSSNLKMFPKWRGTLERFEGELKAR